ncbi:hypothetical protein BDV95DRAFT_245311 [Massariosphaeria phaeospora]|uniref:Uncharacterized protein n=1 Tax=Massariosphaeria phaeospora TaxID=100035 RepID=A0A7C8M299_9PLEO|nr:hypothetical protein BDV95DRAFT_245311 [Massariosphaeria phaeospora]
MSTPLSPQQAPALPSIPEAESAQPAHQPAHPLQQLLGTQEPPQAVPTAQPITTATTSESRTLREKLRAGDSHWQWKIGLRLILVLLAIIGIGCAAWTLATFGPGKNPYEYELNDSWAMPWTLITFGTSVVWSVACILVFFLRRANAPVHPGAQVGMDLVLWLAFIPTGLFAVVAVMSVMTLGEDGRIGGPYMSSGNGYYYFVETNNTWQWNASASDTWSSSYGNMRDCMQNDTSYSSYSYGRVFTNCTEEDIYVNDLWKGKSHRFNTELTATVCQFLCLLLHFILFVWACVDTNHRNSRKVGTDAEKMAADIVMKMVQSGAIVPAPGAAHMRPVPAQMPPQMMQQGQIPPHMMQQMFPQQFSPQQHPQHYGHFVPQQQQQQQQYAHFAPHQQQPTTPAQPAAASSSNEKGAGPRFA